MELNLNKKIRCAKILLAGLNIEKKMSIYIYIYIVTCEIVGSLKLMCIILFRQARVKLLQFYIYYKIYYTFSN